MEKTEQHQDLQKIDKIEFSQEDINFINSLGTRLGEKKGEIGRRKYEYLKSLDDPSEEQMAQIEEYEKQFAPNEKQIELQAEYWERLYSKTEIKTLEFSSKQLWEAFRLKFAQLHGKPFVKTAESVKNLEPLIYYFSKDNRFFECENLHKISKPSFEKGLLIVGGYGNGKTSVMRVFESIFKPFKTHTFKGYTANEVVVMFEKCTGDKSEILRTEFEQAMFKGIRYFDDVKTERIASNFGKVNIFKDILESRYNNGAKTFLTCNYAESDFGNLEIALEEFGVKYGGRIYDRIFEMFNVIEFKGGSFRQ